MNDRSVIDEILDAWEDQQTKVNALDLDEFVRQFGGKLSPEQVRELRQAVHDLEQMDLILDTAQERSTSESEMAGAKSQGSTGQTVTAKARFRIAGLHARGGLGEVYLASDEELGREVALKVIQPSRASLATSRSRFLREARLTSRLQHPGVVPVYASGADDGDSLFYVMRFVTGRTLQEALQYHHKPSGPERDPSVQRLEFQS
jgi:hypothetical protein